MNANDRRDEEVAGDDKEVAEGAEDLNVARADADLLLTFPQRGLDRCFAGFGLATRKAYLSAVRTKIFGALGQRELDLSTIGIQ